MSNDLTYGSYIKRRRKELGLSQSQVCDILLISNQALSQYENDKVSLNIAILGDFCKVLQVDIKNFLNKTDNKESTLVDNNTFNAELFSKFITSFRMSRNLSQKELAANLNVTNNKISKWEIGKSLPTLEEFLKMVNYYHVDADEFYFAKIDSFKAPEVEVVHVKSKTKKRKTIFILSVTTIAVILGIALPLSLRSNGSNEPPTTNPNDDNNENEEPLITTYNVQVNYDLLPNLNKEITLNKGDLVPKVELDLPLEYQNDYKIIDYQVNDVTYDFSKPVLSDFTINCLLEEKLEPQKEIYEVKFFDTDKITPLKVQKVLEGESAIPPDTSLLTPISGHEFDRWDKNYYNVESNLDIYPIFKPYNVVLYFHYEETNIPPIQNYDPSMFDTLPILEKEGYLFDGWFLINDVRFTKDTFLEKEMHLYPKFVQAKDYKIFVKGYPELPLITVNFGEQIIYDELPKPYLKNETFLYYKLDQTIINSSFIYEFNNDIYLTPIFEDKIEYKVLHDNIIELTSFHSVNEEVFLPSIIKRDSKTLYITLFKKGIVDIPNAKTLIVDTKNSPNIYKHFIKNAPKLENIEFLDPNKGDIQNQFKMEKDLLSNLTTLKSLKVGKCYSFDNTLMNLLDFGINFNPDFKVILASSYLYNDANANDHDFFIKNSDTKNLYKNISTLEFHNQKILNLTSIPFEEFVNLKTINIGLDVEEVKTYNFINGDLTINVTDKTSKIKFEQNNSFDYKSKNLSKLKLVSNSDITLFGEIYADEIDLSELNSFTFDLSNYLYPDSKLYFPKEVKCADLDNKDYLVFNHSENTKVEIYFKESRPITLLSNGSYYPFKGLNGDDENKNFIFNIL